jgi:three-Cys-motif partner protein
MIEQEIYHGREQTLVKHFILRRYLERFAHIIGSGWNTITYVDCFSGPWQNRAEDLKDTSFAIALGELRKARATHAERGKELRLRCMFLEKDPAAYAKLREFADQAVDIEVETRNSELVAALGDVLAFIRRGGSSSFIFIDPTGWKGFEMALIAPLLRLKPGEVLINFMTDFIRRFIDRPDQHTREQFADLFGSDGVKDWIQAFSDAQDREDALITSYAENVQETGGFPFTCAAIILYPEIDRRFFHLIYATRSRRGVGVFKEVEQRAMEVQNQTRAELKQRKRVRGTGQAELFSALEVDDSSPMDLLRCRYLARAQQRILDVLRAGEAVPYERVWDLALSFPLVWECDVKDWLREWCGQGQLTIEGLKPRQRVPKLGEANMLIWHPRR